MRADPDLHQRLEQAGNHIAIDTQRRLDSGLVAGWHLDRVRERRRWDLRTGVQPHREKGRPRWRSS